MRAALVVMLSAALLGAAAAGREPSWYDCWCDGAPNCMCPSTDPPGGLSYDETPQFILFTHDDAITWTTDNRIRSVTDGPTNPNGCPTRATLFTSATNTDCGLAWSMWNDGYEIADHTQRHTALGSKAGKQEVEDAILRMRSWMAEECGVPASAVKGFRNPYLQTAPLTRETLHKNGFLYDSSLIEGRSYSLSDPMNQRVWPYTLDHGIAQNCGFYYPAQTCNAEERYPGLWEVPMWTLSGHGREETMDYGLNSQTPLFDILKDNFDQTYRGNKAPFPIYIHSPWFTDARVDDLKKFMEYTQTQHENVYWVTVTQLIEWMNNPVPASQLRTTGAMCGMAPSPPPPPPPPPPSPPPPQAMPGKGLNITLDFKGGNATQFEQHSSTLASLLADHLGLDASDVFVRSAVPLSSLPLPEAAAIAAAGSAAAASPGDTALAGAHVAAASVAPAVLHVTAVAIHSDPVALQVTAEEEIGIASLAGELEPLGLQLAKEPSFVPFQGGQAIVPAAPPPPPTTPQGTVHFESSTASGIEGAPQAPSEGTVRTSSAAAGGSSGLPLGALAGIAAVAGIAATALIVGAAVMLRRRRQRATQVAAAAPTLPVKSSAGEPAEQAEQPSSARHHAVTVSSAASTPRG